MADPEVRFPETYVSGVPVWAKRRKRRNGLGALLQVIIVLLALFGAMVLGVSLRMGSVAKGGAVIDQWVAQGKLKWNEAAQQARDSQTS
jgi:hypothetical protein